MYRRLLPSVALVFSLLFLLTSDYGDAAAQSSEIKQPPKLTSGQIRQIKERTRVIKQVSRMLSGYNLPFSPHLLFTKNWQSKLAPYFNEMQELQVDHFHNLSGLKGVFIANELSLPAEIKLEGDTVILARRLLFRGQNVNIKGPFSLHLFVIDSVKTQNSSNGSSGTITVDLSGRGRNEWLDTIKQKTGRSRNAGAEFVNSDSKDPARFYEDHSGLPGADGEPGEDGVSGQNGVSGADWEDGRCSGNPDGRNGIDATGGMYGTNGSNGGNGRDGEKGGDFTFTINDVNDQTQYILKSNGGNGGNGGRGGSGGSGGNGGRGGNGGNGASCSCERLGHGGDGGRGGNGGDGGWAGEGGNGGNGGNGGTITINYPFGYNTDNLTIENRGGRPGLGGKSGTAGFGGFAGPGGNGGKGGKVFSCESNNGNAGAAGNAGQHGNVASPGDSGNYGEWGTVTWNMTGGGGGGGTLEPGGTAPNGCIEWYWVYYTCYPVNASVETATGKCDQFAIKIMPLQEFEFFMPAVAHRMPGEIFSKINYKKSLEEIPLRADIWECYETNRIYAGCW